METSFKEISISVVSLYFLWFKLVQGLLEIMAMWGKIILTFIF